MADEPRRIDDGLSRPGATNRRRFGRAAPDRVLWPQLGLTKGWMLAYYRSVADVLLPHLRGHPVTLHRFPEGVDETHWFQTDAPAHPKWVRTVTFGSSPGERCEVMVLDDLASLLWAAQIGGIELHPHLGTVDALDRPTGLVLDLDPEPPAGLLDAARTALLLRDVLGAAGLQSFLKSSGRKGLHVVVPLDGTQSFTTTKAFARAVAALLAAERPDLVTDAVDDDNRAGTVLVDWSPNDARTPTVAPYSLRGLEVPTASAPLTWDEVADAVATADARSLWHTADEVLERVAARGDLHVGVLTTPQRVPG